MTQNLHSHKINNRKSIVQNTKTVVQSQVELESCEVEKLDASIRPLFCKSDYIYVPALCSFFSCCLMVEFNCCILSVNCSSSSLSCTTLNIVDKLRITNLASISSFSKRLMFSLLVSCTLTNKHIIKINIWCAFYFSNSLLMAGAASPFSLFSFSSAIHHINVTRAHK